MKKRKLRINKLRQQADELLSYTSLLLKIDESYVLITQVQSLAVNALKAAQQLAPDDQLILSHLRTQEGKLLNFKSGQRENKVACYVTSDIELTQAQSQIGQISKLLDIYRNKGSLTAAKCQELQIHLQTVKVELNINSNLYQADSFAEEGDMTMYQMHIKQALDLLKKTSIDNDTKNTRIRELSELLTEAKRTNRVVGEGNLIKPQAKKAKKKKPISDSAETETNQNECTDTSTEQK
ncbi:hypothetical protein A3740_07675 [Oleiphilus sp. HI0068]|nr:hypothetical protein A3729_05760 [Oleiphilus sp. HI0043]KZY59126.1 hypothetical protein A3735_02765 [Oleiphilus sp. HI0061]KZY78394.1 hypothetical protein A3740_07675 [Oleiphilus sp. HI0068]KZY83882.1 hypothetical protein A3741_03500 [Oleiphilus sp. HI0069]KZY89596.1 hypothetical protein A3743_07975 [Oleiphilus sp. HI0072]KZZ37996.1 hypothetical protein A3757_09170 [Oleiphilus sp. HI0117]KZZ38215.1 hypothetical protein A3756_10580 [Oleiphilus sp. HI0086]KZZ72588.1 hypothetical protein A37